MSQNFVTYLEHRYYTFQCLVTAVLPAIVWTTVLRQSGISFPHHMGNFKFSNIR